MPASINSILGWQRSVIMIEVMKLNFYCVRTTDDAVASGAPRFIISKNKSLTDCHKRYAAIAAVIWQINESEISNFTGKGEGLCVDYRD